MSDEIIPRSPGDVDSSLQNRGWGNLDLWGIKRMNDQIKLFIVAAQPSWQNMITHQLNLFPDFLVVGIAGTVKQAVKMGNILDFDLVIIDLQLGPTEKDSFKVYNELKKIKDLQAIFLTDMENKNTMYNAFLLGGYFYIPKTHLNVLPQTIRFVHNNPVPKMFMNAIQDKIKEIRLGDLTSAEKTVFNLLRQGIKPKNISGNLQISLYTVRSHIKNVLKKLEVNNYRDALKKLYGENEIIGI
jgi:DNA-binding NarL/FixJ family response regulator